MPLPLPVLLGLPELVDNEGDPIRQLHCGDTGRNREGGEPPAWGIPPPSAATGVLSGGLLRGDPAPAAQVGAAPLTIPALPSPHKSSVGG